MKDRNSINSVGNATGVRLQQVAAVAFMAVSALYLLKARTYPYADYLGPGAGFFPFWIGLLGLVTGGALLAEAKLRPANRSVTAQATPATRFKIILTVGVLVLVSTALESLGFRLTACLVILVLLRVYGSSWRSSVIAAIAASLFVFFLFHALGMRLPVNELGF